MERFGRVGIVDRFVFTQVTLPFFWTSSATSWESSRSLRCDRLRAAGGRQAVWEPVPPPSPPLYHSPAASSRRPFSPFASDLLTGRQRASSWGPGRHTWQTPSFENKETRQRQCPQAMQHGHGFRIAPYFSTTRCAEPFVNQRARKTPFSTSFRLRRRDHHWDLQAVRRSTAITRMRLPTSSSPRHGIWLMQHLANAKGKGSHLGGTAALNEWPPSSSLSGCSRTCIADESPPLLVVSRPPLPPKLTGQQQIRALRSSETVPQFGLLEKRYLPQDYVPHYGQARECSQPCKLARTVAQFIFLE